jgi:hypothetical protein
MHSGTSFGYVQFTDKSLFNADCKTYTKIRFVKYTQRKEGTQINNPQKQKKLTFLIERI